MAGKIITWTPEQAEKELKKRLSNATGARTRYEQWWRNAEKTAFATGFTNWGRENFQAGLEVAFDQVDSSMADVNISYAFKNLRFLHAQLSANPPAASARPTSNDPDDRQKADAAGRLLKHALREYDLQEMFDRASLNTLAYGTGFLKIHWDQYKGAIIDVDEEGNVVTEGDINIAVPNTWDIFLDPDANTWEEVRFVFERRQMPYEEAIYLWPDKEEALQKNRIQNNLSSSFAYTASMGASLTSGVKYDTVEVYEYWEKGLHTNAFLGRFGIVTKDGTLLQAMTPSPFRFKPNSKKGEKYEIAELPYSILTDIDVPSNVWGKSMMDYLSPLQDTLNKLDSINLDNVQAHGVTRMVIPESADIADQSLTNSPWDIVKITGNQAPYFVNPPSSMPQIDNLRAQVRQGIDDMAGINEAMFGQSSREQSGALMQYAASQGNMIRRRLFNKYAIFVEDIYKKFLNLVRKHWTTSQTIYVIGKEKALEAIEIKGADISGGYDLVVEYGDFSLDPITRRQEIMTLLPLFQQAGINNRTILQMMKLNEIDGIYDFVQLAEDRQREIFQEMVSTNMYIQPEQFQDHQNMLAYSYQYVMTTEFKYLEDDKKALIRQHMQDRASLAAQEQTAGMGQQPPAPPAAPAAPGAAPEEAPAGAQPMPTPPNNQ